MISNNVLVVQKMNLQMLYNILGKEKFYTVIIHYYQFMDLC